jgi:hypothetical protein
VVPEEGQSSIGTFTLPLQDQGGEVLRYLSNPRVELAHTIPGSLAERLPYIEGKTSIGGYPAVGTLQLGAERVRYRDRSDATNRFLNLEWAVDGTSPQGHPAGAVMQNGEQLRAGQRIQLLAGYRTLDERKFLRFAKMEVTGVTLSNDGITWMVALADIQKFLQKLIFLATQDNVIDIQGNPFTIALRTLLSTGTAAISTGTVQLLPPNVVLGTDTDLLTFIRPGETLVVSPFAEDERVLTVASVESPTTLYVVESIDTPSAAGLDYRRAGVAGVHDVFRGSWALGTPKPFVDVEGLEALRDRFSDARMRFRFNAPEDAKEFLEREIWKPMNAYPWINQDGQYSARIYEGRSGTPVATSIDEDQIIGWTWQGGEERIINQVEASYDWNETTAPNSFGVRQRYSAAASIEKYGRRPALKMLSKGLRTTHGVQEQLDRWAFELLQRFSDSAPRLQLIVRYGQHVVDIGDTVPVTHSRIPNRATGTRGLVNEPFQVRDLRPMFGAEGKVIMTLIQVSVLDAIDQPVSDGTELARTDLVVLRASYFNAATEALAGSVEEIVASVTVTLTSPADTVLIQGKHFAATGSTTATPSYTSRIRVGGLEGTILDATDPEGFMTSFDSKSSTIYRAKRDNIVHQVLYAPNTTGAFTVVMTAVSNLSTATSRNRSLVVTVRRP